LAGGPLKAEDFQPRGLLRNPHLQSTLGSLPPRWKSIRQRAASLLERAQPLLLDCGAGVRLQAFYTPLPHSRRAADNRRLAILLHGWEGDVDSPYVLSAAALLHEQNWPLVRLNLRDHGGTQGLNRDLFHSCRLPEVVGAVRALAARFPAARPCLGGFSLGGNFMLRAAADANAPDSLAGAVAVSPVLEPEMTLRALERGWLIYRHYFVRRWSASLRLKQRAWPDHHDFEALLQSRDLRRMTADLVRASTQYASLQAYLSGYAITGNRLECLRVPAHLLTAADDPIIPAGDLLRVAQNQRLTVVRTRYGGHCGFIDSLRRPSFADRYMLEQFELFDRQNASGADQL
jgi:hypothetical protein